MLLDWSQTQVTDCLSSDSQVAGMQCILPYPAKSHILTAALLDLIALVFLDTPFSFYPTQLSSLLGGEQMCLQLTFPYALLKTPSPSPTLFLFLVS